MGGYVRRLPVRACSGEGPSWVIFPLSTDGEFQGLGCRRRLAPPTENVRHKSPTLLR